MLPIIGVTHKANMEMWPKCAGFGVRIISCVHEIMKQCSMLWKMKSDTYQIHLQQNYNLGWFCTAQQVGFKDNTNDKVFWDMTAN